jgi:hypothetical protein
VERAKKMGLGELEIFDLCNIHSLISLKAKEYAKAFRREFVVNEYINELIRDIVQELSRK